MITCKKLPLLSKTQNNKRGMLLIICALGILVVFALLGLALNENIGGLANKTSAYSALTMMDATAFEVANSQFFSFTQSLNNPDSENFKTIFSSKAGTLSVSATDLSRLSQANDLHLSLNSVSLKFEKTGDIGSSWLWKDSNEKFIRLTLNIDISGGRSKYKMFRRRYQFSKNGKLLSKSLPLVSKFTMFIKNPEQTDNDNIGYNCIGNFVNGKIGYSSKAQPLLIYNSVDKSPVSLLKSGWIYLGGDKEIQLHISSGNHVNYGELFQFHSIVNPEKNPPVFKFTKLPNTTVFNDGVFFLDSAIKAKLSIKGAYYGFYNWDEKGSSMNKQGVLQRFFASEKSRTMNSSFLHLTGDYTSPSPTIVVGNVKRVFAYYSGLLYSAEGEGNSTVFLDMLEAPPKVAIKGIQESFWNTLNLKRSFSGKKFSHKTLTLSSQEVTTKKLFQTKANYLKFCSNLIFEPYNKSYDYMFNPNGTLPPKEQFVQKNGMDYEISGSNFTLKSAQNSDILFKGNCQNVSSKNLLLDRITLTLANAEEFKKRFLINGRLDLKNQNVLINGPIEIPANLEVATPGTICAQGKITLLGGIKECEKGPLTLLAIENDIIIKAINQDIYAHLISLEGTVYPSSNNSVRLIGALAMDRLYPDNGICKSKVWSGGGSIKYDSRLNPFYGGRKNMYSICLSDCYSEFKVFKEKQ